MKYHLFHLLQSSDDQTQFKTFIIILHNIKYFMDDINKTRLDMQVTKNAAY